jgi:hypothetical protein
VRGFFWILSYILLFVGVIAALTTAIMASKQLGKALGSTSGSGHTQEAGLPVGSRFPDLSMRDLDGEQLRLGTWPLLVLVQCAIMDQSDIDAFSSFLTVIPERARSSTLVSAIGPEETLRPVAQAILPARLVFDRDLHVEAALRSRLRPFVAVVVDGVVQARSPFSSIVEMGTIVSAALIESDPERLQPVP